MAGAESESSPAVRLTATNGTVSCGFPTFLQRLLIVLLHLLDHRLEMSRVRTLRYFQITGNLLKRPTLVADWPVRSPAVHTVGERRGSWRNGDCHTAACTELATENRTDS